jgi:phosphoglycerate dehydrogenase-like enzyme
MPHTVLYLNGAPQAHRDVTLSVQPEGFIDVWIEKSDTPEEVRAKLAEADFIVGGRLTAEQIAQAQNLKMIQMPGVGYEHLDIDAAEARGIPCAITPGGPSSASPSTSSC